MFFLFGGFNALLTVMFFKEPVHLVVRCWGEHVALQRVFGQIVGVGHHQVATMEVSGEHERDGADPFHDSVSLWCNLDFSIKTYSDQEMKQIRFIRLKVVEPFLCNVTH